VVENRREKLKILETEINAEMFRDPSQATRGRELIGMIKNELVYVSFDKAAGHFLLPAEISFQYKPDQVLAKEIYSYVLSLFTHFNFHGLPNPQVILHAFQDMQRQSHPDPAKKSDKKSLSFSA
jgi:hypothetical protein